EVTYDPAEVVVPPFLPDSPECRGELAQYYLSVSWLDQGIGFLLEELEKSGQAGDTLVIYISDNGIAMPGAKTTIYDPGILMPMLVRCPSLGLPGGSVCDAMVSFTDLVPTILDWTGARGPDYELPGRSFLPVIGERNPAGWDEIFCSHTFHEIQMYYPMRSIRTRKYKYILNLAHKLDFPFASDLFYSDTWQAILTRQEPMLGVRSVDAYIYRKREELYDLENDPDEVVNLAGDPARRAALTELRGRLKAWQEATDDPWLVKYTYE
ncbi:MAG: sulfatase-like hydrolase/transferase, partial [Candidatus Glassbacteria bacterium]|nr:sulfatase-like hydrolase/transferase [Candidatus Glassbacteria bacterium]